MTFYLLNNPNPSASGTFHGHRADEDKTAVVLHTTESDPGAGAEAPANYIATTHRTVSYHTIVDDEQALRLMPWGYVAFGVRGFNRPAVHVSWATYHNRWGLHSPGWEDAAIRNGAEHTRRILDHYDIPARRISASQARNGVKGICTHMELDPSRRQDPGPDFPSGKFMALLRGEDPGDGPGGSSREVITVGDQGGDVVDWQENLLRWDRDALPEWGADGVFGDETVEWTLKFMDSVGLEPSDRSEPRVGSVTHKAMSDWLDERNKEYAMILYADNPVDLSLAYAAHTALFMEGVVTGDRDEAVNGTEVGTKVYAIGAGSAETLREAGAEGFTEVSGSDRGATFRAVVEEIIGA